MFSLLLVSPLFLLGLPARAVGHAGGHPPEPLPAATPLRCPITDASPPDAADLSMLVRRWAAKSPTVAATLRRYRVGDDTGLAPRLAFRRGDAGRDRSGRKARASFHARFVVSYEGSYEEIRGEEDLFPVTARNLTGAILCFGEVVLDDSVETGSPVEEIYLLHELGHAEGAARDPLRYLALGADEVELDEACEPLASTDRPLEQEADGFLRRAAGEAGREREIFGTSFPVGWAR